ncbi:hypothetical protein [Dysgonomonas massiliensis]|uniref:hypothetical protein n=1 Tax=Dysgonomonas massiliensis TaxID=2040292 RepID=UPI0011AF13BC|nr:hypothetical protein [Dysgonomonas massiliensis]
MRDLSSVLSTICFFGAGFCAFLLFGGLFSAHWDDIIQSFWDSTFVLILGTLVPLFCIVGIIFTLRSFFGKGNQSIGLSIFNLIVIVCTVLFLSMFYTPVFTSVVELYKIKLGIL